VKEQAWRRRLRNTSASSPKRRPCLMSPLPAVCDSDATAASRGHDGPVRHAAPQRCLLQDHSNDRLTKAPLPASVPSRGSSWPAGRGIRSAGWRLTREPPGQQRASGGRGSWRRAWKTRTHPATTPSGSSADFALYRSINVPELAGSARLLRWEQYGNTRAVHEGSRPVPTDPARSQMT
jgi:hypothetical protein